GRISQVLWIEVREVVREFPLIPLVGRQRLADLLEMLGADHHGILVHRILLILRRCCRRLDRWAGSVPVRERSAPFDCTLPIGSRVSHRNGPEAPSWSPDRLPLGERDTAAPQRLLPNHSPATPVRSAKESVSTGFVMLARATVGMSLASHQL